MESTLCTVPQLKALTSLSQNLDCELLQPHLLIAQQLYIQPILGDPLYNDIVSRYDNQTLTGDSLTLYEDYIIPAIGFAAWFSSAPFLHMRTQRAGIQTLASPDNTPVTVEELSLYIARVENYKNFYCQRLNDYLVEDNYTKFPLFRSDDTPQNLNKGSSFYLGFDKRSNKPPCCNNNWWQ
jgi:hypothetical protein